MSSERQKTIDRIRKLFAMSTSAFEHEADAFDARARAMLAEHNLTMADLFSGRPERQSRTKPPGRKRPSRDRDDRFSGKFTDAWVSKTQPQPKEVQYAERLKKGLSLMLYVGAENQQKESTKTWRVLFYRQGKPRGKKLGTYPALGVAAARAKALDEFDPEREIAAKAAGTFKEVAEKWLIKYVRKKRLRSEDEIVRQLTVYVYPILGKTKIHDIKRLHVNDLLDDIEHKRIQYNPANKKKKNKTRKRVGSSAQADAVLATIRAIMGWWEAQDGEYTSPIVKGMKRDSRSSDEKARERVLEDHELHAVWQASAWENVGIFGGFVRMLIVTAQRRNTVAEMKWADVTDGVWTIPNEHREKGHIGAVRLPRLALDVLDKQPRVNEFVFPAIHKGISVLDKHMNSFSQGKEELDRLLPDDMPGWTLHDLRRTARTAMQKIGVSDMIAERTLGHKLQGVMMVYMRHKYLDEKSDALARLAAHIDGIVNDRGSKGGSVVQMRRRAPALVPTP